MSINFPYVRRLGPEYYVNIMSFVDKDQLEPGTSVLTHNKVSPITILLIASQLTMEYCVAAVLLSFVVVVVVVVFLFVIFVVAIR